MNTIRLEADSQQLNTVISLTRDSVIPSIFCLVYYSLAKKHNPTFLSDKKAKLYENAELSKIQNKLLVGEAFLVSRTLRIEAAAIRGRLQNALFAAVK